MRKSGGRAGEIDAMFAISLRARFDHSTELEPAVLSSKTIRPSGTIGYPGSIAARSRNDIAIMLSSEESSNANL
jgi:hypothetical protein